ncbi:alkyl sulfatase dimerization domain-containing protein [Candidatus Poriferisocius sp.]|uniref:alkyl sulfatase dimerization domain-containing protein n=1 Tax=Candidatus Poriferisocius sp. TaxID=3101276 RepID=UPI003B019624
MTLLERSARYIDEGIHEGQQSVQPMDGSFHEIADGIALVCAFSHIWSVAADEGLVVIDTSLPGFAPGARDHLRRWKDHPVHTIVYTHGHVDHVGGAGVFVEEAREQGRPAPRVLAHEDVERRFDRYDLTSGYNQVINRRQFGDGPFADLFDGEWVRPQTTYSTTLDVEVGSTSMRLIHAQGETDDHTFVWVPQSRALFAGDLFIWFFPNAGNPQKVQRYPAEWAAALRRMIELRPALLLPAHGLPIEGEGRIATVLDDVATALEGLVADTLEMMNAGARLDDIIHQVRVPDDLLAKPYLRPNYDEPEFVVRNIWRLYGGWYDGNPAHLKPAPDGAVAAEVAGLAGGASALAARAVELSEMGELRLACHLAEWAAQAAPDDPAVIEQRAEVYRQRRSQEQSLMSRGIYNEAAKT